MYADNICLLASTATAMQYLLDVCYEYGTDNDNLFAPIKSVYALFSNQKLINCTFRPFISLLTSRNTVLIRTFIHSDIIHEVLVVIVKFAE